MMEEWNGGSGPWTVKGTGAGGAGGQGGAGRPGRVKDHQCISGRAEEHKGRAEDHHS